MKSVVLYFHVHQPYRLRQYSFFEISRGRRYFDDALNEKIVRRVTGNCYLPVTDLLRRAVERTDGRFRCALSITGTLLDQMERWAPEALEAFQALAATGGAEFVAETSHHSLASLGDEEEFRDQVRSHAKRLERLFGARPRTFRNTELVFDDRVARAAEDLGFDALLGEGADHLLGWRAPHAVFRPEGCDRIGLLLRSYHHSDDIAFRFSNRAWEGWPLTPAKFAASLARLPDSAKVIGLFMDFETAGEHQGASTGILDFFERLPEAILAEPGLRFATPAEAVAAHPRTVTVSAPRPVSWADQERDLSAWLGNDMQKTAHETLYAILPAVRAAARAGRRDLLRDWRRLSTSDHVYYMCTKWFTDGDVHKYFSPYDTPHEAYVWFLNAVDDLRRRAEGAGAAPRRRRVRETRGARPARDRRTARPLVAPAAPSA